MGPEEVLELMRTAPARYSTVRAALRYRGHGSTIKNVRRQYLNSDAYLLEVGEAKGPTDADGGPEPDGPFTWNCRVWHMDNIRWRRELDLPGGGVDIVASIGPARWPPGAGELWHRRVGGGAPEEDPEWLLQGIGHFWTFYPFDPDGIAGIPSIFQRLELSIGGKCVFAGREAVRLIGVPVEEWHLAPEPLWWGADEYELVVDIERGVVLRLASRLNG